MASPNAPQEVLDAVQKEYDQSLVIPKRKPIPQWMLMPVGLIGSGKTTVVKALAEHFGLIRISTDDIRKLIKERGYSYEGAREIADEIDKKYLPLGYSLAIDANTGSSFGLAHNKRTLEAFPQVKQIFIHINPPEEFIIRMLQQRDKNWLFENKEAAIEKYYSNKETFTLPNLPFVYTFDTSKEDFSKQLEECIKAIEKVFTSR